MAIVKKGSTMTQNKTTSIEELSVGEYLERKENGTLSDSDRLQFNYLEQSPIEKKIQRWSDDAKSLLQAFKDDSKIREVAKYVKKNPPSHGAIAILISMARYQGVIKNLTGSAQGGDATKEKAKNNRSELKKEVLAYLKNNNTALAAGIDGVFTYFNSRNLLFGYSQATFIRYAAIEIAKYKKDAKKAS